MIATGPRPRPGARPPRVVLADDDATFRDAMAEALRGGGLEVLLASSGLELVERVAYQGPIGLLITDVYMPWMNGLQALGRLRALGLDVPAVVISAWKDPELAAWVRFLGPRAHLLCKPFHMQALWNAVNALLPSDH